MTLTINNNAKEVPVITPKEDGEDKDEQYRQMPSNVAAERSILGALLTNNEAISRVGDFLKAEHFFEPVHQRIFSAITTFSDRGMVATPVTLKNYFEKDEALADVGGAEYLVKLAGMITSIINIDHYAKLVYDLAMRRSLISIGEDVVNKAYEADIEMDAKGQIELAEQNLFNLASEGVGESNFVPLKTSVAEAMQRADSAYKKRDSVSGISTKFTELDKLLGGLQDSDLIILAGRPSMGKTAVAVNIALNACNSLQETYDPESGEVKPSVGFFSLEMSAEQLAARMIAMESGVDSSKMRSGFLNQDEFSRLVEASKRMHSLPFFVDDTPAITISALRTRARRLKRKHNLAVLIVDYLQLVRGFSKRAGESRVQEISEITQGLKAIAKELNIPVIALSQLSRAVESREDKRPMLSDLRESGSIEQDADIVMFIFREEYYELRKKPSDSDQEKYLKWQSKMEEVQNKTELIIAKQRNGPVGTANLYFNSNTTKFENLDTEHDDEIR